MLRTKPQTQSTSRRAQLLARFLFDWYLIRFRVRKSRSYLAVNELVSYFRWFNNWAAGWVSCSYAPRSTSLQPNNDKRRRRAEKIAKYVKSICVPLFVRQVIISHLITELWMRERARALRNAMLRHYRRFDISASDCVPFCFVFCISLFITFAHRIKINNIVSSRRPTLACNAASFGFGIWLRRDSNGK